MRLVDVADDMPLKIRCTRAPFHPRPDRSSLRRSKHTDCEVSLKVLKGPLAGLVGTGSQKTGLSSGRAGI
jgi:hypothetical protein